MQDKQFRLTIGRKRYTDIVNTMATSRLVQ